MTQQGSDAAAAIAEGHTSLGVELGSTNIKACLIGPDHEVLATGTHGWENQFVDRLWTYSEEAIWTGLQAAVASLMADVERRHGVPLTRIGALGFSAMMHGYLAFDANGTLLVPFRTWRNTNTGRAAAELTKALDFNFPLRWSASHVYQAILDEEPHVAELDFITTLAGFVHWRLTGRKVIGVGDASGMFPIDPATHDYDAPMLAAVRRDGCRPPAGPRRRRALPQGARRRAGCRHAHRRGRRTARPDRHAATGYSGVPARGRRRHGHGGHQRRRPAHRQHQRGHVDLRDGGARKAPDGGA